MKPPNAYKVKKKIRLLQVLMGGAFSLIPLVFVATAFYYKLEGWVLFWVLNIAILGFWVFCFYFGSRLENLIYRDVIQSIIKDLNILDDLDAVLSEYGILIPILIVRRVPDLVLQIQYIRPQFWGHILGDSGLPYCEYLKQDSKSGLWKITVAPQAEDSEDEDET